MKVRTAIGMVMAGSGLLALQAVPALAAGGDHTVTMTEHQHGTWTEQGDTDFCTNELITPTITGNSVFHETYFPAGDEVWGTFTTEGTGSFLQPSSGLTFSGRVTVWGNFNVNEKNSNDTFTATFKLSAVDGDGVTHYETGHQVFHVGYNAIDPINPIVTVEKMNVTCS
ncbi:hypothetical protein [Intrasporangium oryzae]|nr:hypothetical protein [Intrasporangium oryzae]